MCKLFKQPPPKSWNCPCEECMDKNKEDSKRNACIGHLMNRYMELLSHLTTNELKDCCLEMSPIIKEEYIQKILYRQLGLLLDPIPNEVYT